MCDKGENEDNPVAGTRDSEEQARVDVEGGFVEKPKQRCHTYHQESNHLNVLKDSARCPYIINLAKYKLVSGSGQTF